MRCPDDDTRDAIHDYGLDDRFARTVQRGIVDAVQRAATNFAPSRFFFALGEEKTVGQNSRMLLDDGQIYWIGPRTNFVRPTAPFDPELPVLTTCTVAFTTLYFRKVYAGFLREGCVLGLAFVACNLLFDLPMFSAGPMKMPLLQYLKEIGLAYLSMPIISLSFGYMLQAHTRRQNSLANC